MSRQSAAFGGCVTALLTGLVGGVAVINLTLVLVPYQARATVLTLTAVGLAAVLMVAGRRKRG